LNNKKSVKSLLTVLKYSGVANSTQSRYVTRNIFPLHLKSFRYAHDGKNELECDTTTFANGGLGYAHTITQLLRVAGVSSSISNTLPEIYPTNFIDSTTITDGQAYLNTLPICTFSMPLDLDVYNGSTDVERVGIPMDTIQLTLTNDGTAMTFNGAVPAGTAILLAICDCKFILSPDGYLSYDV
jgi:hypothetical protein